MSRSIRGGIALLLLLFLPRVATAQSRMTPYEQLQVLSTVINQVRRSYVDSVSYHHLVRAAVEGMLASLDPHSRYESREEFERRMGFERGELASPGIAVDILDGAVIVLGVADDSPAARAGLQPGDRVKAVDGETMEGVGAAEIADRLLGEKGSRLRLTLARGSRIDPDTFTVSLRREQLELRVVSPPVALGPEVAYVRLALFDEESDRQLRDAIREARKDGARQLVLDLRNNPGGSLAATSRIANLFLPEGALAFELIGRTAGRSDSLRVEEEGEFRRMPLVVLVNESSASAAEILAASLQDLDRAVVVGRRTFGKALAQQPFPLPSGDVVWLTTARVRTASGRFIQRRYQGIAPGQYEANAGQVDAAIRDSQAFRTIGGRPVSGGGGVLPDIEVAWGTYPAWFSVASDSGWTILLADSVAATLPAAPTALMPWVGDSLGWKARLLEPLTDRVRGRLDVHSAPDARASWRMARSLAARVAEVRWGTEGGRQFLLRSDPDVAAALDALGRYVEILAPR
ncbi:MAG TPA: S41 family peptidase [Gemmatimonadales bacterium]|nr:S41 family peptidase [Gemmatimonadales bacterium]